MRKIIDIVEELPSKVNIDSKGCWIWKGCLTNGGYGRQSFNGKTRLAHRVSYEAFVGEIPEKLQVLHTCDIKRCINPAHLFLGTQKDNMDDMRAKGREGYTGSKGEEHPNSTLTEQQVYLIRSLCKFTKFTQSKIGKIFGISNKLVSLIKRRVIWKHLLEV